MNYPTDGMFEEARQRRSPPSECGRPRYRSNQLFAFNVEIVRTGKTISEYIITDQSNSCIRDDHDNNNPEFTGLAKDVVEKFCNSFIKNAKHANDPSLQWHETYYVFESLSNRRYRYIVTEPNLD